MADSAFWVVFFSAALALNLSPGPDIFYVLTRTLSGGRRIGVIASLGVCSGALVHVLAAALGISAILAGIESCGPCPPVKEHRGAWQRLGENNNGQRHPARHLQEL